jgi:hypothetical protein
MAIARTAGTATGTFTREGYGDGEGPEVEGRKGEI